MGRREGTVVMTYLFRLYTVIITEEGKDVTVIRNDYPVIVR